MSTVANTSLGAFAVIVLATDPLAGLLLIVVGATLVFAYTVYDRLREQDGSLSALQDLIIAVGASLDQGQTSQVLLEDPEVAPRRGRRAHRDDGREPVQAFLVERAIRDAIIVPLRASATRGR